MKVICKSSIHPSTCAWMMSMLLIHSVQGQWISIANENAAESNGCVTNASSDTDYFPDKVQPVDSEFWDIEYNNSYKILTNKQNNATYLLYQCGTASLLPEDTTEYNATIEVPISQVSVQYVNTISYLEQLNKLDSIVAYTDEVSYIGSPCFLESIANGEVNLLRNTTQLDDLLSSSSASDVLNAETLVAFSSPWVPFIFKTNVITSTEYEKTNDAIFEWVKFHAAFFNLEAMANEVYEAAQDRSKCLSTTALNTVTSTDGAKPIVLWAYYSDYCGGWDIGNCPNYYCEFASACSATILNVTKGSGSITNPEMCGDYTYFSIEEVMNIGLNADYWIFPGSNWDATYANFSEQLKWFKSVQNKAVYDVQGSGLNAWYEQRYAEYYDVQQDLCSVVGTTVGLQTRRGWFRNVMKNETVGGLGQCSSATVNETSILPYDFRCEFGLPDDVTNSTSPDDITVGTDNGSVNGTVPDVFPNSTNTGTINGTINGTGTGKVENATNATKDAASPNAAATGNTTSSSNMLSMASSYAALLIISIKLAMISM